MSPRGGLTGHSGWTSISTCRQFVVLDRQLTSLPVRVWYQPSAVLPRVLLVYATRRTRHASATAPPKEYRAAVTHANLEDHCVECVGARRESE